MEEMAAIGVEEVHLVPGPGDPVGFVRAAGVDMGVWHFTAGMPLVGRLGFGLRCLQNRS